MENLGIEHNNVDHCEEGDDTTADLGRDGGAALGDLEELVELVAPRVRLVGRGEPSPD